VPQWYGPDSSGLWHLSPWRNRGPRAYEGYCPRWHQEWRRQDLYVVHRGDLSHQQDCRDDSRRRRNSERRPNPVLPTVINRWQGHGNHVEGLWHRTQVDYSLGPDDCQRDNIPRWCLRFVGWSNRYAAKHQGSSIGDEGHSIERSNPLVRRWASGQYESDTFGLWSWTPRQIHYRRAYEGSCEGWYQEWWWWGLYILYRRDWSYRQNCRDDCRWSWHSEGDAAAFIQGFVDRGSSHGNATEGIWHQAQGKNPLASDEN